MSCPTDVSAATETQRNGDLYNEPFDTILQLLGVKESFARIDPHNLGIPAYLSRVSMNSVRLSQ